MRQTRFACALCLFLAALPASAAAQKKSAGAPVQAGAIKTTSLAVNVYAIAEGRHGRLARELSKDDFELTEDAVPQKIEFFSRETDAALNLGVAVDTSVSQAHLLGTEQAAAKNFLRSVLRNSDQAFVMNFDVDVNLRQDFTNKPLELARAIDSSKINSTGRSLLQRSSDAAIGGTHLYDAIYLASNELMKTRDGRKVLVLLTDGEDQGSKVNLLKAREAAEKADVIVYSIVVSDPDFYKLMGKSYRGDASVRKLARETGGRTIRVKSAAQIGSAFEQIAQELRSQYLLGYSPSNTRADGSFRRIQVKVRGRNCTVRARTGYYAHSDENAVSKNLSP